MSKKEAGKLKQFIGDSIRVWGARDRFVRNKKTFAYKFAFNYLKGYRNHIYKMENNGEKDLLERFCNCTESRPKVFFDVGANAGEWSKLVAGKYPDAMVHSFEMCPGTYENLRKDTAELSINCHNTALSDRDVDGIYIHCRDNNFERNSIDIPLEDSYDKVLVKMSSGDTFCKENGIREIDFLKIDTEGHEMKVLKGFGEMLHQNRIKLIQFELNEYSINLGITLNHFQEFFGDGYRVGKIYPKYIDFEMKDRFNYWESSLNYIAVPADGDYYRCLMKDR